MTTSSSFEYEHARGAGAVAADRWETTKCAAFCVLALFFVAEQLGVRMLLTEALDPQHCSRGGGANSGVADGGGDGSYSAGRALYLDRLAPVSSSVGYGAVGRGGRLGFEGRCVKVRGRPRFHSLGMHPPAYGSARAVFSLPASGAGAGKWRALRGGVAINDDNNFFGNTGGPIVFALSLDGRELWRSREFRHHKQVQRLHVALPLPAAGAATRELTLEVRALQSNACSHAVWVDPLLLAEFSNGTATTTSAPE
jgi:hypothetical protein